MNAIKNLFWDSREHRPRAMWRLIGQIVLYIMLIFSALFTLAIVGLVTMALQGDIANLLKPEVVANYFAGSPFFQSGVKVVQLGAIVLSVWLAGRLLDRRGMVDFGLHLNQNWWLDFGFGLFLGAFLMLLIFLAEWGAGWVAITGAFVSYYPGILFPIALLAPLIVFIFVGVQEELLSRGYQLQNMAEGLNGLLGPRGAVIAATLLSSAVFGGLHVTNPNASLVSTLNLVLAGAVLLGVGRLLTGELAIPIGVHISWNFFQGNVFGFPVSGTTTRAATVLAIEQSGPALWTGGAFGPEAGLVGIAGILLAGLLTILWVRWRYGQVSLELALARPPEKLQVQGKLDGTGHAGSSGRREQQQPTNHLKEQKI